jgi:transposase
VIRSLPGMGTKLAAEFIAATGGDMDAFGSPDRLAGFAGLAPGPRDSGRVSGNLRRPRRYHRGLRRSRGSASPVPQTPVVSEPSRVLTGGGRIRS